jgi:Holliday junction DNA helicase RuvA
MIGRLKGVIDSYGDDWVIVDVGGVGYHVFCSAKTHAALPPAGEAAQLFTEMLVSENAIRLVGFATSGERDWFKLLESVQGVGTKVALAILSVLTTAELTNAIALGDKAMVGRANGVGPKLAQRIVSELKDKAPKLTGADPALAALQADLDAPRPTAAADAVSALVNLGYNQTQAGAAVTAAMREGGEDGAAETLIRLALKELAR